MIFSKININFQILKVEVKDPERVVNDSKEKFKLIKN